MEQNSYCYFSVVPVFSVKYADSRLLPENQVIFVVIFKNLLIF